MHFPASRTVNCILFYTCSENESYLVHHVSCMPIYIYSYYMNTHISRLWSNIFKQWHLKLSDDLMRYVIFNHLILKANELVRIDMTTLMVNFQALTLNWFTCSPFAIVLITVYVRNIIPISLMKAVLNSW